LDDVFVHELGELSTWLNTTCPNRYKGVVYAYLGGVSYAKVVSHKAKLMGMNSAHSWTKILTALDAKIDLSKAESVWAMEQIMGGEASEEDMTAFLVSLRSKGETLEEISSFVDVMLAHALPIPVSKDAVDIVGTGGDQLGTVNISTMAAILTSACGYPVLKHGSRSASGKTGSSEMLEALGVNLDLTPEQLAAVFKRANLTFFFAPMFHPSLKHVGPTRKKLGIPTTFNFLGPLANPAQPVATALGVANPEIAPLVASVMALRGRTALIFRGSDGLDELTTTGPSSIWIVFRGKVVETTFDPLEIGIQRATVDQLIGGNALENAQIARSIFGQNTEYAGERSQIQDIVALNAAAGISAYELSQMSSMDQFDLKNSLAKNFAIAREAILDGRALAKLNQWVELSQSAGE
jgi:anthranilate phosphoribosyltransferase